MPPPAKDRFLALRESNTLNGIDFVELMPGSTSELQVHFVNAVAVDEPGITATITGGDRVPTVPLAPIAAADWSTDAQGRPVLALHALAEGDFSFYTLTLSSSHLDRFFRSSAFTFKVECPSDFDCAPPPRLCPPDDAEAPPIDYLAKDYLSFKRALTDFSALRYADWQERSEADFGMMFLEALSGLGDELSYLQDRVAAEAALETATERRSIERLARLVDYQPRPATSARTLLVCNVSAGPLPAGVPVSTETPAGQVVPFEIGRGLSDHGSYPTDPRWNYPIAPYWWDDAQRCLLPGTTEMYLAGHGYGLLIGLAVLIDTAAANTSDPPTRAVVHLTEVEELTDPLFGPALVTRIAWSAAEALTHESWAPTCCRPRKGAASPRASPSTSPLPLRRGCRWPSCAGPPTALPRRPPGTTSSACARDRWPGWVRTASWTRRRPRSPWRGPHPSATSGPGPPRC
jgi:hypothetical protein